MIRLTVTTEAPIPAAAHPETVIARDGVALATDVYRPEGPGPFPVVLSRMPYDKASPLMAIEVIASVYVARGYVFVAQDVRGRFRSGGRTYPFVTEIDDTYDTIDWIVAQPWSDGRVGMTGDSYHGYTQWAGLVSRHPALRAIAPRVTGLELGAVDRMARTDRYLVPLYMANYFAHYWVDGNENHYDTDWSVRPLAAAFDEPFRLIGARSAVIDDALNGTPADDPFADVDVFAGNPIPVLHRVGWQDNLLDMSMRDYVAQRSVPAWRDHAYLDADSCDHYSYRLEDGPATPDTDHGVDADAFARMLPRYLGRTIDFFDAFLAGTADPETFPRVSWRQGFAEERSAESWPPAGSRTVELRLSHPEQVLTSASGGVLAEGVADDGEVHWVHDPEAPVPSTVVNPFVFAYEYPQEQAVQARGDVATFTAEPADHDIDLTGPVAVVLEMSSDAPSVDAHVKLTDVHPDGRAHMILRGQDRIHGAAIATIDLGHTGYRLRAGHRLRLQIACSDFPLYAPNPATGEPDWTATSTRTAQVRLGLRGSVLRLTTSPIPDHER